ncbi:MAG: M48 family metalloprotease [Chlorobia bacterium]|nr:M48 family metalloprotease [Fimbriimonadaceae bacterium]
MKRLVSCIVIACLGATAALAQDFTQAELEKMVAELDAVSTRNSKYIYPIKCSVVTNDDVNAYASIEKLPKEGEKPQGVMVVYTGLVKFAKNDRKLIRAVVAHEVAHLMQGHVLRPRFVATDLEHLWTRQQEMDADLTGAKLLERAGYPKKDMIDMLAMLDTLESDTGWMYRLSKNDHTSAKNRMAQVAGNTDVMRSMMSFEKGLAFMECRSYGTAANLFEKATRQEPKFLDAFINAAQASLMSYYDKLPGAIQDKWFIPDFGPMLTENPTRSRDAEIRDEDRDRFKLALRRIADAKAKMPTNARVLELETLAAALDPDVSNENLIKTGDKLKVLAATGSNFDRVRFANNAGVAYHRAGDVQKAYDVIIGTLKATRNFSNYLGQNLGRFNVPDRSKEDEVLVLDVMVQWLNNAPTSNRYYGMVKDTYTKGCSKIGVQAKDTTPKPTYLCYAAALVIRGKECPILVDTADYVDALGAPLQKITISEQYPDVQVWNWANGEASILTERDAVVRVSTHATGAYLDLRPSDDTVTGVFRIVVGMTEADFNKILDLSKSVEKKVIGVSGIETWNFYPNLNFGVQRKDGRISGVTVSPTK